MNHMLPDQARMARAALSLIAKDVAGDTGIGINTITRFERGTDVRVSTMRRLQSFYESRGIEFIPANGGGAGVRLK